MIKALVEYDCCTITFSINFTLPLTVKCCIFYVCHKYNRICQTMITC